MGNIQVTEINGPVSFYAYYLQTSQKLILLFGDVHSLPAGTCVSCDTKLTCVGIIEWLTKLFDIPVCIDFFLEQDFPDSRFVEKSKELLIAKVKQTFLKSDVSKFGNVRIHHSDIRSKKDFLLETMEWIGVLIRKKRNTKEDFILLQIVANMHTKSTILQATLYLIGEYQPPNKRKWASELFPYYKSNKSNKLFNVRKRIKKQLDGIGDTAIKQSIVEYATSRLNTLNTDLKKEIELIAEDERKQKSYGKVNKIIIHMNTIVMDVYLLARLFKDSMKDSHVVVIYAGDYHIKTYVEFLEDYMKPIKLISKPRPSIISNKKCIHMSQDDNDILSEYINQYESKICSGLLPEAKFKQLCTTLSDNNTAVKLRKIAKIVGVIDYRKMKKSLLCEAIAANICKTGLGRLSNYECLCENLTDDYNHIELKGIALSLKIEDALTMNKSQLCVAIAHQINILK